MNLEKYALPELYLLTCKDDADGEKLFKLTLYSLLARDILAVEVETRDVSKYDPVKAKFVYITKGKLYDGYTPKAYEKDLLDLVKFHKEQARFFIAKCYFRFESYENYKDKYFYTPLEEEHLMQDASLWNSIFKSEHELTYEGEKIKLQLDEAIKAGKDIFEVIDQIPSEVEEIYLYKLAPMFFISEDVTDEMIYGKFIHLNDGTRNTRSMEGIENSVKSTIELWNGFSADINFKKVDFEEIFAMNPHYFEESAIMGLLAHNSGFSFAK